MVADTTNTKAEKNDALPEAPGDAPGDAQNDTPSPTGEGPPTNATPTASPKRRMQIREVIQEKITALGEMAENAEGNIYDNLRTPSVVGATMLSEAACRAAAEVEARIENHGRALTICALKWVLGDGPLPHDVSF